MFDKTLKPPLRARENKQTAPGGARKYTPSAYGISPGGGDFSSAMPCDTYEAEWEATSKLPPPGEVVPQAPKGVHFPRAEGLVVKVSLRNGTRRV